jgi:hypothetical protein
MVWKPNPKQGLMSSAGPQGIFSLPHHPGEVNAAHLLRRNIPIAVKSASARC